MIVPTRVSAALAVIGVAAAMVAPAAAASAARAAPAVSSSSWPMALHDPHHTGATSVLGPQTGHVSWTRDLGAPLTPGPVTGSDGTIYVATSTGVLHAIDPATGVDRWILDRSATTPRAARSNDLSVSPLVLSTGAVVWPAPDGTLVAVSPSGAIEWSHHFSGSLTSPVVTSRGLYVGTTTGTVIKVSLSGATPVIAWTKSIGHVSYASAVVAPDGQIVTTVDNCVVDLADNGASASIRWFHAFRGAVEVSAAVSSTGTIVVGANTGFEYGFTPSGHQKWRVSLRRSLTYSSPAITAGGIAYFGDNNGVLRAVKVDTGRPIKSYRGNHGLWAAQAIDRNGDVYFGTQGHSILGYSARGRRLLDITASSAIGGYPALDSTGQLIIGDQSGTLYAIG